MAPLSGPAHAPWASSLSCLLGAERTSHRPNLSLSTQKVPGGKGPLPGSRLVTRERPSSGTPPPSPFSDHKKVGTRLTGEETSSPATFPTSKVTQTKLGEQRVNTGCDARVYLLLFCCLDYPRDHLGTEASRIKGQSQRSQTLD